jgi:hypothetical protein
MQALERANRVRLARAALKRKVAAGLKEVPEVVLECPWEAESMGIAELLMSQRRWGRTRCRKFLAPLNLNENKPLGTLTERQRLLLAAALRAKAGSPRRATAPAQPAEIFAAA